jgi:hypothetical protein
MRRFAGYTAGPLLNRVWDQVAWKLDIMIVLRIWVDGSVGPVVLLTVDGL